MAKGHSLTERKYDAQKLETHLYKKLVQAYRKVILQK